MADVTAERRLVKSRPELWAEVSEVERLAEHLGELGEIRITKVEPETTVAWEGEQISGTVSLEQAGWGTKVTLSATVPEPAASEPVAVVPPAAVAPPVEPEPGPLTPPTEPEPGPEPIPLPDPEPDEEPEPVAEPTPAAEAQPEQIGFWARLFRRRRSTAEPAGVEPAPEPDAKMTAAKPEPEPTVTVAEPAPVATAAVEPEPQAAPAPESKSQPEVEPPVVAEPDPEPVELPAVPDPDRVEAVLHGTLDALGQAHHRPFSRG